MIDLLFLKMADEQTKWELEQLVNGEAVVKKLNVELTYRELYDNIDNVWSVLFSTGYLTKRRETARDTYELVIPNQELCLIFTEQIFSRFQEEVRNDTPVLDALLQYGGWGGVQRHTDSDESPFHRDCGRDQVYRKAGSGKRMPGSAGADRRKRLCQTSH